MGIIDRDCMKQLADFAGVQQQMRTGHPPKQVDIAMAGNALVMVLHDALTAGEQNLSKDPTAAIQLQAFHRELFLSSSNRTEEEIARITGRSVLETVNEIETASKSLVYAPATGVMIQVYMLTPESNPDGDTLRNKLDSIERAEDDGLRVPPPKDH